MYHNQPASKTYYSFTIYLSVFKSNSKRNTSHSSPLGGGLWAHLLSLPIVIPIGAQLVKLTGTNFDVRNSADTKLVLCHLGSLVVQLASTSLCNHYIIYKVLHIIQTMQHFLNWTFNMFIYYICSGLTTGLMQRTPTNKANRLNLPTKSLFLLL